MRILQDRKKGYPEHHIDRLSSAPDEDAPMVGRLVLAAKRIAKERKASRVASGIKQ